MDKFTPNDGGQSVFRTHFNTGVEELRKALSTIIQQKGLLLADVLNKYAANLAAEEHASIQPDYEKVCEILSMYASNKKMPASSTRKSLTWLKFDVHNYVCVLWTYSALCEDQEKVVCDGFTELKSSIDKFVLENVGETIAELDMPRSSQTASGKTINGASLAKTKIWFDAKRSDTLELKRAQSAIKNLFDTNCGTRLMSDQQACEVFIRTITSILYQEVHMYLLSIEAEGYAKAGLYEQSLGALSIMAYADRIKNAAQLRRNTPWN